MTATYLYFTLKHVLNNEMSTLHFNALSTRRSESTLPIYVQMSIVSPSREIGPEHVNKLSKLSQNFTGIIRNICFPFQPLLPNSLFRSNPSPCSAMSFIVVELLCSLYDYQIFYHHKVVLFHTHHLVHQNETGKDKQMMVNLSDWSS